MSVLAILDPERCWKEWIRTGSLNEVRKVFEREGIKNPRTLEPPTLSAIEKAAYRWVLNNQEEGRQDLEFAWSSQGQVLNDFKWKQFLASKAKLAYFVQPRKIEKFLTENGLLEYA